MIINRENVVEAACVGGCIYWIVICLALFVHIVTVSYSKSGVIELTLIFSTFIGAGFYSMVFWTILKPNSERLAPRSWSLVDAIVGFSPVLFILFWAAVMIHKVAND